MSLYRSLRPLLFALPPEAAHDLAFVLFRGLESASRIGWQAAQPPADPLLQQHLWGLEFPNPVGLAAGFDKSARAPHVWQQLGFGFAELGTITAQAQAGNPRPRLFRLKDDQALINRLGFNNDGAQAVARRLAAALSRRSAIPLGINIGKSKTVPIERATDDYVASFRLLFDFADYFVINVSSPNTPGLRDLQEETRLGALARALAAENTRLATERASRPRPLLIKVAPDLASSAIAAVVSVAQSCGLDGLVATNTTIGRAGLTRDPNETGGLSGRPLRGRATEVIRELRRLAGPSLPIIGAGGIFGADDAYEKIRAGASLVQIYTGFIYEGPALPGRICAGLAQRLRRDGFAHLSQAVGQD